MFKICLVEDEPYIIEALSFLFEAKGWAVHTITDGAKAVKQVEELKPDVLVLDYMLPNKSGVSVASDLRAIPEMTDLPILMLTAKGQEKDKIHAKAAGIHHYMTKPFSNDELIQMVSSLLPSENTET